MLNGVRGVFIETLVLNTLVNWALSSGLTYICCLWVCSDTWGIRLIFWTFWRVILYPWYLLIFIIYICFVLICQYWFCWYWVQGCCWGFPERASFFFWEPVSYLGRGSNDTQMFSWCFIVQTLLCPWDPVLTRGMACRHTVASHLLYSKGHSWGPTLDLWCECVIDRPFHLLCTKRLSTWFWV